MSETDTITNVMPSATPSEAEIEAWNALPRDEQLKRLRLALAHPDCTTPSTSTMTDILKRAQDAAKPEHG